METYTTEEQEIEAVKQWWKENGMAIGLGIVIGLGGLFGWRGYQAHQIEQAVGASTVYEQLLVDVRTSETEQALANGQDILDNYADTEYAVLTALILAKLAHDENDLAQAKTHLQFARDNAEGDEIQSLAQLRLARLAYTEDNYDEALGLLSGNKIKGFDAAVAELKGDIYLQQGDVSKAREEYALALSKSTQASANYALLEMKLDSLGS